MSATAPSMLGMLAELASADVVVHPNRCVRVRNRHATCTACADVCAGGAIRLEDRSIKIDGSACIGCGTCATACPTCALESANPSDADLLDAATAAMRANDGQAVFVCARELDASYGAIDESKVVRVTCLGRVDESLLAGLAAAGASDVALITRLCDRCEHNAGRDCACSVAQSASQILAAWGADLPIETVDEMPVSVLAEGDLASVDALADAVRVASAREASGEAVEAHYEKVGKNGVLPQHVPSRRGRLLKTLSELGTTPEEEVASRLWAHVSIDTEKCGSCRLCAVFCPTGALYKFDDRASGTFGIEHDPAKCVACGTCRDICPKSAIDLLDGVAGRDLYQKHAVRFEMRPRDVEPGKPDTIIRKMRGLLADSQFVSQA